MLFNSWTFALFLPLVWVLHYAGRRAGWQAAVLTVASFVFYGWGPGHLALVPLLAASTFINGLCAQQLLTPGLAPRRRRVALALGLGFNVGALAFYKYAALLAGLVLGPAWTEALKVSIPLPVGISFYTFQGISLVIESWRAGPPGFPGLSAPTHRGAVGWFHLRVWFFKAFFPQLIAGPIVKAGEFFHQIGPKRVADIDWDGAARKLIVGFFLKMVVADNLKEATAALNWPYFQNLPRLNLWLLLYGFSFQILADFAGYSAIAQGLAKLFGYELPINFNHPYLAGSLTEFWRRWHISLSSWLREYLYIPLGGNRRGGLRTYVNLFLVMFLGGLWHGAAWSYAVWGTAHGCGLAVERALGIGRADATGSRGGRVRRLLAILVTFNLVSLLWLLFKLPDFSHVRACLRCLITNPGGLSVQYAFLVVLFSLPVVGHHLWAATGSWRRQTAGAAWNRRTETAILATLLALTLVNPGSPGEFIYFQF